MPYYKTCPHCGLHLDPSERCDCQDEDGTQERVEIADEGKENYAGRES